ncbi:MAG: polysaccharide pyruvyl transferase family protein [Pseudomonadota bacterium]|nr:polysaccharide pyruvyl transferase family protein [Pseudomonadota bacterium]
MKILHAYCLNNNIGDYFLGMGTKNLLRQHLDVDLIAEENLQGRVFDEYYINNVVNKKYDLLVIGGGGIIHGAHWPNGWFWLIDEKLVDQIEIPFVVYGAGYNYFKNETGIPEIGKSHLRKTIERATFFSVRNDGSSERFQEDMGLDVPVVPDPGFHINLNRSFHCPEVDPFVMIQLANDKPEHRFGSSSARSRFVKDMREVTDYLRKKYKVIFSPHVFEDVSLSREISESIPNTSVWDFSKYAFDRCSECVGFYEKAEFVLAMRGHGQIVPMAFGTPVISLENHPKHSGLMRELGLENYNLPIASQTLPAQLIEKIELLEATKAEYSNTLKSINTDLLQLSDCAFRRIGLR